MNRRKMLVGLAAALPLAIVGWANRPAADAANAKHSLGCGCCCEDPNCPPGCDVDCPPDCDLQCLQDCCSDPSCPPGCNAECPSDCNPCVTETASKQIAAKQNCGPDGCCTSACAAGAVH